MPLRLYAGGFDQARSGYLAIKKGGLILKRAAEVAQVGLVFSVLILKYLL